MADDEQPTSAPRSTAWWVGLAIATVLALAASGAGVFRGFERAEADTGSAVRRALVGALVGAAAGAIVLAALAWYRSRRRLAAGALGGGALAALLAVLVAAAATLGASTAPTATSNPDAPTPSTAAPTSGEPFAALLDAGTGNVYADLDGDGVLDTLLVPCPPLPVQGSPDATATTSAPTTIPPYRVGDQVRIAIDNNCDGIIERWIYAEVRERVQFPAQTTTPRPNDPSGFPAGASDGESSAGGMGLILLLALAGLAVVGLIVALARGWNPFHRALPPGLVEPLPDEEPASLIDEAAAADSLATSARRLLDDPDPRRAIIAAYAELLDGLAAAGAERAPFEAPEEHLQRSLRQIGLPPTPLAEVTRLFLVARFSAHPLDEQDRSHALRALQEAERHLRSAMAAREARAGVPAGAPQANAGEWPGGPPR